MNKIKSASGAFFYGVTMKKVIISSAIVIVLGLLIALGPKFIFKVCDPNMETTSTEGEEDCCAAPATSSCCGTSLSDLPICFWTAQAEMGMGLLIVALGACMIVFTEQKTHLGLLIGIFLSSIIALAIPNFLITGCTSMTMRCHKVAFPALTIESAVLLVFSAIMITLIAMKKSPEAV
jgi:hypothetical protein